MTQEFDIPFKVTFRCLTLVRLHGIPSMNAVVYLLPSCWWHSRIWGHLTLISCNNHCSYWLRSLIHSWDTPVNASHCRGCRGLGPQMLSCTHFPALLVKFWNLRKSHPHLMRQPLQLWSQEFDTCLRCIIRCLTLAWFQGIASTDAVIYPSPSCWWNF